MDENTPPQNNFFKNLISFKALTAIALLSIFINIAYVEISSLLTSRFKVIERITQIIPFADTQESKTETLACPAACISEIYQATASSQTQQSTMDTTTPSPALEPTPSSNAVKEFFVPFGSGSSLAGDWEDVSGVQATIDTANYGELKSATFEATVRIPTGNQTAYIRLYNVTDKHPVWSSEMSWEGGGTKLLTKIFTLDSGNKTYQIQMKTSLKFQAIFDQARLHIITN